MQVTVIIQVCILISSFLMSSYCAAFFSGKYLDSRKSKACSYFYLTMQNVGGEMSNKTDAIFTTQ